MSAIPDLEPQLATPLQEEAQRRTERVRALVADVERLAEWETTAAPEGLRALIAGQRAARAAELADLLISWRRLGGELLLRPALAQSGADERVSAQAPTALPAVAVRVLEVPRAEALPSELAPRAAARPLPPAAPPLNLASAEALAGLKAHVETGGGFRVQAPPADWPARLAEQLKELLPGRDAEAELSAVLRVVDNVDRWKVLPPEVQAALVGLLAARLRFLQDVPTLTGDRRIDFAFGSLSAYVKRARPGFVYGLARWHTPVRGSWEADGEAMYDRLAAMVPTPAEAEPSQHRLLDAVEFLVKELDICPAEARSAVEAQLRRDILAAFAGGIQARHPRLIRMLASHTDLLDGPEFRTLRRAIRDEAEEAQAEEEEESGVEEHLPIDWAWWPFTRGKRALIIGGDPREQSRARLEAAFGFEELEWVGAEFKRNNLIGVRDRVRAGRTDLVILLTRFTGHDADQIIIPACREMNVPFVCVQHGYGVVRVRHAIERFLDPDSRR
jgi:hypothetical protein